MTCVEGFTCTLEASASFRMSPLIPLRPCRKARRQSKSGPRPSARPAAPGPPGGCGGLRGLRRICEARTCYGRGMRCARAAPPRACEPVPCDREDGGEAEQIHHLPKSTHTRTKPELLRSLFVHRNGRLSLRPGAGWCRRPPSTRPGALRWPPRSSPCPVERLYTAQGGNPSMQESCFCACLYVSMSLL